MENNLPEKNDIRKSRKSGIVGLVFTVVITAATLVTLFHFADFGSTMSAIGGAIGGDLAVAIALLIGYILLYPLGFVIAGRRRKLKSSALDDYLIGASEHFFNGITPYQTGAQPFQIYSYSRKGVKPSEGTGVAIVNFLALLISSNIFVALSLIFAGDFFTPFKENGTLWIPIIGICMNFAVLTLLICVATCGWVKRFLGGALRLICKIKFMRWLSKSIPAFDAYCENAQAACKDAIRDVKGFLLMIAVKLACLFLYYSIPYFIFNALAIPQSGGFFHCLLATAFTVNSVVWIPTPGTGGGIEFAFTTVFALQSTQAAAAAIIWRGLTYYILMIVSALEYGALLIKIRHDIKREKTRAETTAETHAESTDVTTQSETEKDGDKNE